MNSLLKTGFACIMSLSLLTGVFAAFPAFTDAAPTPAYHAEEKKPDPPKPADDEEGGCKC